MSEMLFMHLLQSFRNSNYYSIFFFIVSYLPSILWKISMNTELHQKVEIISLSEACIKLCNIGVIEVEVAFNWKDQLSYILNLWFFDDLHRVIGFCLNMPCKKYSPNTSLS